ncbi:MAG: hypothetical protein PHN42_00385 [Bacilli bacterium]|nr:hypothetical protein [Bacilli bacterium]
MEKQTVSEFYNGSASYYWYLNHYYSDKNINFNIFNNEQYQIGAQVSLISLFFLIKKEDLVEKEGDLSFSSKVIDEKLEENISFLAKKENSKYVIDNYLFNEPTEIIALIRNKLAHGDYEIDYTNDGSIILNKESFKIKIPLKKLNLLICSSIESLICYSKTKKISRIMSFCPINLKTTEIIKNKEELVNVIKTIEVSNYILESKNNNYISKKSLDYFKIYIDVLKQNQQTKQDDDRILLKLEKQFESDNTDLIISSKKIKLQEDINKIIKMFENENLYNAQNLETQIKFLTLRVLEIIEPNYLNSGLLPGILYNLILISKIYETKNLDMINLIKTELSNNYNLYKLYSTEMFISSILMQFYTLFCFPFDNIYLNKRYSLNRENCFDFGKLNLDFVNPTKLTIYNIPLDEALKAKESSIKELSEIKNNLLREKTNLEKVTILNNTQAIEIINDNIIRLNQKYNCILSKVNINSDKHIQIKEDYIKNEKYFKNRAIIEGIRNAIAHGNIKINKYKEVSNFKNTIISFKDIYNENIEFELDISISDFEKLFSDENIITIQKFLNNQNDEEINNETSLNKFQKIINIIKRRCNI